MDSLTRLLVRPTLVVCFVVSAASAQAAAVASYEPTRDTYIRGVQDPQGPQLLNGTSISGRASKSFLDFYITDFDRAAINTVVQQELGHPLTVDDMANVRLSLNLFSNADEGYEPTALSRPAVFLGTQDWVEGTNSTLGATKNYAVYDPANAANNRTWKNVAGADVQWFFNLDKVENANFEEWGGEAFTYRQWFLDDTVAFAYLTDPLALGLFLNASDAGNAGNIDAQYSNTEVYSRENSDPSFRPFLQLIVIPEPALLPMLAFGASIFWGASRRRRRFR